MPHSEGEYDTEKHRRALAEVLRSLDSRRISTQELKFLNHRIGTGGYGEVLLAAWETRPDGANSQVIYVAVKKLRPHQYTFGRLALRFARELKVWSTFRHPNVLACLGFDIDLERNEAYFVSSYFPRGSVRSRLNRDTNIPIVQRKKWIVDVTKGLAYLHSLTPPVAHGDLKSENILLDNADSAVLCDFGLSSVMEDSMSTGLTTSDGFKGSLRWCSPELLDNERRTTRSDMWAWALCVLEIATGKLPFYNATREVAVFKRILGQCPTREEYRDLPSNSRIWETLDKCFLKDPNMRPTALACLAQVSLPPPSSTPSTITTWDGNNTHVFGISRSGHLALISYPYIDGNFTSVAIENLGSGFRMVITGRPTGLCPRAVFNETYYSFSQDDRYWAWYDIVQRRLYVAVQLRNPTYIFAPSSSQIYELQGGLFQLVANLEDPTSPPIEILCIHFWGHQLLLFHTQRSSPMIVGLSGVLDVKNVTWAHKPLTSQAKTPLDNSISPDGQCIVLRDNHLRPGRTTGVYTTSSLLSFAANSSAAFPEPVATILDFSLNAGFWISNTAYASPENDGIWIRVTDTVSGTVRRIRQAQQVLELGSADQPTFGNDCWLVYEEWYGSGASIFWEYPTLHYYHAPTILASSNGFDWSASQSPPHFREQFRLRNRKRGAPTDPCLLLSADF